MTTGTVLLTGASGAVGRAVLDALAPRFRTVCLTHRTPVADAESVSGDVREPRLGLPAGEYADLVRRVDAVVHSAGLIELTSEAELLRKVNVGGTRHVLELAADAGARMYHVSTAFVSHPDEGSLGSSAYIASKRTAEEAVRASGVPSVILRPSVVIGHSASGAISRFQGVYLLVRAFLQGLLPFGPADPGWLADLIPCDVVADTVAGLVSAEAAGGEYWLTAGDASLSLRQVADECIEYAHRVGRDVDRPVFVTRDVFERLFRPVFLPALPARMRSTLTRAVDMFSDITMARPFPSSLDALGATVPDSVVSLRRSLAYWGRTSGFDGTPRTRIRR